MELIKSQGEEGFVERVNERVKFAHPLRKIALPAIGLLAGIILWEIAGLLNPVLLSTPMAAFEAVVTMAIDGVLAKAFIESAILYVIGLTGAIVFGVGYGLAVSRSQLLATSTLWFVYAAQAVPVVGLTPFVLAGLGFGIPAKALIVFLISVFPILLSTAEGARQVPVTLVEVAKLAHSTERQIWVHVLVPHTLPFAMSGIRQGIATAFVGTIAAEFFINASGIGGLLVTLSYRFDIAGVSGVTVLLAVFAVGLVEVGRLAEVLVTPWNKPRRR